MNLHGSISKNLLAAIRSARRLRKRAVHPDTLRHWADLLALARLDAAAGTCESFRTLILELENELSARKA